MIHIDFHKVGEEDPFYSTITEFYPSYRVGDSVQIIVSNTNPEKYITEPQSGIYTVLKVEHFIEQAYSPTGVHDYFGVIVLVG